MALALCGMAAHVAAADKQERFETAVLPFVGKYCVSCHNDKSNSGGLDLTVYKSTADFKNSRETWERIARRIAAGDMPPRRGARPPADETEGVTDWLGKQLEGKPMEGKQ